MARVDLVLAVPTYEGVQGIVLMIVYLNRARIIDVRQHVARCEAGVKTVQPMTTEEMIEDFGAQLAVADQLDGVLTWRFGYDPGGNIIADGKIIRVAMKRAWAKRYIQPFNDGDVRWNLGVSVIWTGRLGSEFAYTICGQITRERWLRYREPFYCANPFWFVDNEYLDPFRLAPEEVWYDAVE